MRRALAVMLVAVCAAACGSAREPERVNGPSGWVGLDLTPEPGFDPGDPALRTIPDDQEHIDRLLRQAGHRPDFKVPRASLEGLQDGPLVLAVVARPFYGDDSERALRRLNDSQRAVYAFFTADFEILNGGFSQLYYNSSGDLAADLLPAAERVGSAEFVSIYRDAAALWPGGRIPRDGDERDRILETLPADRLAALDERYAATQYKRETALANVLGPYIRAHLRDFAA